MSKKNRSSGHINKKKNQAPKSMSSSSEPPLDKISVLKSDDKHNLDQNATVGELKNESSMVIMRTNRENNNNRSSDNDEIIVPNVIQLQQVQQDEDVNKMLLNAPSIANTSTLTDAGAEKLFEEKLHEINNDQQQSTSVNAEHKEDEMNSDVESDAEVESPEDHDDEDEHKSVTMKRSMSHMGKFMIITELPTNKMISTGVLLFEHNPQKMNQEVFKRLLFERVISKYTRFRSLVNEDTNEFEEMCDDSFNIDNHFHTESIRFTRKRRYSPEKNAQLEERCLRRLMSRVITRPFNKSLPLWDVITVDDYSKGFLVMWRIHHCIGDGTSLAMVVAEMGDNSHVPEQFKSLKEKYTPSETHHWFLSRKLIRLVHSILLVLLFLLGCIRILIKWTFMALSGPDPPTRFKGQLTEEKIVGFKSKKIKLTQVKEVGKVLKTTVNDVVMSCFAGALDRYCKEKGDEVTQRMVRLSIPVNIRTNLHEMLTPSNKFGFIVCKLPLGINDTLMRLKQVKKEMDYNKKLPEQVFSYYVGLVTGYLPKPFVRHSFNLLSSYQTAVLTNIRGPTEEIAMNGVKVLDITAFAPQPGGVGVGALALSYNGYLNITVVGDQHLLPDAHVIADYIIEEFQVLYQIIKADTLDKCWE